MKGQQATSTNVELLSQAAVEAMIQSKCANNIAMDMDDPFYVCDLGDIIVKHQRWLNEFPRIQPHYAVKCNPDPTMLKLLMAMGLGFDCASKSEIQKVLDLGVSPDRIVYANPCKQLSHIRYAKEKNLKLVVFDGEQELFKMKKRYPDADLVLRIETDDSASLCRFSMKYGAPIEACPQLIDKARELGLNVVGISFHVGSGCRDVSAFTKALRNSRKLFDYAATVGYDFKLLDIGGGFPGTENVQLKFEEITSVVNFSLEKLFPVKRFQDLRVIAEPGRFYAASAFTLATNVIAKRKVARDFAQTDGPLQDAPLPSPNFEPAFMYYINDGLYGSFNCLYFDHAVISPSLLEPELPMTPKFTSSIWGPTCDGMDKVMDSTLLPELCVGDWIIWKDMGAYTVAAGSSFNGFKTSKIYYYLSAGKRSLYQKLVKYPGLADVNFIVVDESLVNEQDNVLVDGGFAHTCTLPSADDKCLQKTALFPLEIYH